MEDREKILLEAFEHAISENEILKNETDNADPEIGAAMAQYLMKKGVEVSPKEIGDLIRRETEKEDRILEESYREAVSKDKAGSVRDEMQTRIQKEMEDAFRRHQASIRHKRIELYVQNQVNKLEKDNE